LKQLAGLTALAASASYILRNLLRSPAPNVQASFHRTTLLAAGRLEMDRILSLNSSSTNGFRTMKASLTPRRSYRCDRTSPNPPRHTKPHASRNHQPYVDCPDGDRRLMRDGTRGHYRCYPLYGRRHTERQMTYENNPNGPRGTRDETSYTDGSSAVPSRSLSSSVSSS
jgi:hypothetical protein